MKLRKESLIEVLNILRKYQRPMRAILWAFSIFIAFLGCIAGFIPCEDNEIVQTILIIMGGDLGVYTVSRTYEKAKNVDSSQESEKDI